MDKVKVYIGIYKIVKGIPKGKVGTYSQVAVLVTKILKDKKTKKVSARIVGFALHVNPGPKNIPCHRVVKTDGGLARGYAFGGREKQKKRLMDEGVRFVGEYKVDMKKCLWRSS